MRKIEYKESCYECFSLQLDIKYLGKDENEEERIEVTCRNCGEVWEDLIDDE